MARSRNSAAAGKGPRPIVTYSHMPPESLDGRAEPPALDPDATILDAVEVPLVGDADALRRPPDLRATEPAAPDLRADIRADSFGDEDVLAGAAFEPEPRRRRGGGRVMLLVALIAIAGGVGAVAASLGVFAPPPKPAAPVAATDPAAELIAIHKQIDALGEASTPAAQAELARLTKRLAELEQSGAFVPSAAPASADAAPAGDIGPSVRQISLSPADEEPAPAAAPPAPRPRPEKLAARPAAEPAANPAEDMPVAEPLFPPPPRRSGPPKVQAGAPSQPPAPAASDDSFIASVEKALAASGDNPGRPQPAPLPPVGAVAPAEEPLAPAAVPLASAPADDEAPIVIAPPAAGVPPSDAAPLPRLDANAADPYALPAPLANARPAPTLPPGVKLPPADIPNVPADGSGQQY